MRLKLFTFFILAFQLSAIAQNAPYSRFGIGDPIQSPFATGRSMGGLTASYRTPLDINLGNPASLSGLMVTSFEVGVMGNSTNVTGQGLDEQVSDASIAYIAIGFPVSKRWGTAFGLVPYSRIGYKVSDLDLDPNLGSIEYLYQGTGSLNRFFLSNGYDLVQRDDTTLVFGLDSLGVADTSLRFHRSSLSLGLDISYVFGSVEQSGITSYPDQSGVFATRSLDIFAINDFMFRYGLQWERKLNRLQKTNRKGKRLWKASSRNDDFVFQFGAYGQMESNLGLIQYRGWERGALDVERFVVNDTLSYDTLENRSMNLPLTAGAGISIGRRYHWLVGINYEFTGWTNYELAGSSFGLRDSWRLGVGGEYVLNHVSDNKTKPRIKLRAGAYYTNGRVRLNDTDIPEYGMTFGVGFPIKRLRFPRYFWSRVNLGVEIGQLGTTDNNLIKENFYRATLGFTLTDKWFIKKKYD
jgi:hypothetical protein